MKKDIEWLKEEVKKLEDKANKRNQFGSEYTDEEVALEDVKKLINQLGEPEVLSQKWIDKHTYYEDEYDFYYADPDELKNLLVPKQGEVEEGRARLIVGFDGGTETYYATDIGDALDFLTDYDARFTVSKDPVIPKFVAEWIEEHRNKYGRNILEIGYDFYKSDLNNFDVDDWVQYNTETFVRAWLYGFTVEEEQRYRVIDSHKIYLLAKEEDRNEVETVAKFVEIYGYDHAELDYNLTEQEIKDYDERYWAFRKPVEELEE